MTERDSSLIRVTVQHRLPLVCAGVAATLRGHPRLDLVPTEDARDDPVQVVVTDFEDGLTRAAMRSPGSGGPRLLVVTDTHGETDVKMALQAGVTGYLLYDCDPSELTSAVVSIGRGDRHLCAKVVDRMANSLMHDELTPREFEVLSLMGRGMNNKLIARELRISVGTVKAHANAVYGKLNASSRLEAVAVAQARGIGASDLQDEAKSANRGVLTAHQARERHVRRPPAHERSIIAVSDGERDRFTATRATTASSF